MVTQGSHKPSNVGSNPTSRYICSLVGRTAEQIGCWAFVSQQLILCGSWGDYPMFNQNLPPYLGYWVRTSLQNLSRKVQFLDKVQTQRGYLLWKVTEHLLWKPSEITYRCGEDNLLEGQLPYRGEGTEMCLNRQSNRTATGLDAQHIIVKGFPSSADLLICLSPYTFLV